MLRVPTIAAAIFAALTLALMAGASPARADGPPGCIPHECTTSPDPPFKSFVPLHELDHVPPIPQRLPQKCESLSGVPQQARCVVEREGMGWAWNTWACIITRESNWSPWVTGAAGERGLTQIHPIHIAWIGWARWAQMYEVAVNIETAVELYRRAGNSFSPWISTVRSC